MATAGDYFDLQLESIRSDIHDSIEDAILSLREKESNLYIELERLEREHRSQILEKSYDDKIYKNQPNKISMYLLNKEGKTELTTVSFLFNQDLFKNLSNIGDLVVTTTVLSDYAMCKPVTPDYRTKVHTVKSCCKKNESNTPALTEFKSPWGLAIDPNTGNIYIADRSHYCIQVFDSETNFLFKFSNEMGGPVGICFSCDRVLVCQWGKNYITVHSLTGEVLKKIGKKGIGELEFNSPWGIAAGVDEILICERENNRVQVLSDSLDFKFFLGEDSLQDPRDVKLTTNEVYVLDTADPCIHVFSRIGFDFVRSFISLGSQISNPYFFDIDPADNIILSDAGSRKIFIFSSTGQLLHSIGELLADVLKDVMGVAVGKTGLIFCVSGCAQGVLNIF